MLQPIAVQTKVGLALSSDQQRLTLWQILNLVCWHSPCSARPVACSPLPQGFHSSISWYDLSWQGMPHALWYTRGAAACLTNDTYSPGHTTCDLHPGIRGSQLCHLPWTVRIESLDKISSTICVFLRNTFLNLCYYTDYLRQTANARKKLPLILVIPSFLVKLLFLAICNEILHYEAIYLEEINTNCNKQLLQYLFSNSDI